MTARKTTVRRQGRTAVPRCMSCGGAAKPGHARTDKHRAALRVRENAILTNGPAHEIRNYVMPSREREEAYWAEEERRAARIAEEERIAFLDDLIERGPLPIQPVVDYPDGMALITINEAARRLGRSPITLRSAIHRGKMVGHKYGRDWLVEESEVRYYEMASLGRRIGWPKGRRRKSA